MTPCQKASVGRTAIIAGKQNILTHKTTSVIFNLGHNINIDGCHLLDVITNLKDKLLSIACCRHKFVP